MTDARSPRRRGPVDSTAARPPRAAVPHPRDACAPAPAAEPRTEAARTFERWIANVAPQSAAGGDPAFGRRPRASRPAEAPAGGSEPREAPQADGPPTTSSNTGFTSFVRERSDRAPLSVPQRPARPPAERGGADRDRRGPGARDGRAGGPGGRGDRGPRPGGDRAPRPYGDRAPRAGGDRAPRRGGERTARPNGDRAPRPYGDRAPRPGGDRAPRPYGDRAPRSGGDRAPRPGGDRAPRPYGDRTPRSGGDRAPRPGGDRAPRPYGDRAPRTGGDRAPRPYGDRAPRPGGDRSPRPYGDRAPRSGGDRAPRPGGDRAPRPTDGQEGAVNRSRPLYGNTLHFEAGKGLVKSRASDSRSGPRTYDRDRPQGRPQGRPLDRGRPPGAPRDEDHDPAALPTNPREAALRILHAADTRSAFSDRMLDGAHQRGGPDPRDLALMHEIVKGTLRWRARLDWALDQRLHIGLAQTQPWIRNLLRLGAYQILFLDRVPAHAAVDEAVKLAHKYGHPGTVGLVNSVLRRLADEKDTLEYPAGDDVESLAVWGSHPVWLVERWLARFGVGQLRALMLANNRAVPSGLRVNATRGTREALIERLAKEDVVATPATYSPDLVWIEGNHSPAALAAFKEGWCTVQDESEALVSRLVDPQQHDRLLDLCAAPGGKSTHLAELMKDEGEVWALERNEARVASLETTVARLGAHAVHVVHGDGYTYTFPMPFDRVLVDAPCSGLGVIGRRADARWRKGPEVLAEMPPVQLDLLGAGGRRVRPGGVLVYSVCSFEPEETVDVVEKFLHQNPQFVLESADGVVPEGVADVDGFMRVLPHVHGCDGAFAARFRKA